MASGEAGRSKATKRWRTVVLLILVVHASLLAWGAGRHSPTFDEVGFLPAGIAHWQFGRFDLYRVNPPLVRMVASVPTLLARPETDWHRHVDRLGNKACFQVGEDFIAANGARSFWLFSLARWACIPFSLLGGTICYLWARDLYGRPAGVLALSLWAFSPNILAHGQLLTPDVGAAALGVASLYSYWRWLKRPIWRRAIGAGVLLGLTELTKMTWVVLFGLWPLLWLAWIISQRHRTSLRDLGSQGGQLGVILLMGLYILNLGYGFEGSLERLREYAFVSEALGGPALENPGPEAKEGRNRFAKSWLGTIPVPVPCNYLSGIDVQKEHFERKFPAYLQGRWSQGGWWYYYICASAVKMPLGTWVLLLLATTVGFCLPSYGASWRDEMFLMLTPILLAVLVSLQTGINHHFRYVLPILPFAFIWMGKVSRAVDLGHVKIALFAGAVLLWSVTSSLWIYPHSLAYFNELTGGPRGGHAHLLGSNLEWGQDLLYLKRWLERHPESRPLHFTYYLEQFVNPRLAGIESIPTPGGPVGKSRGKAGSATVGPRPGWYAISVNKLRSPTRRYAYFFRFRPVAMAGYSIYVYHLSLEESNRVRPDLGLPELSEIGQPLKGRTDEHATENRNDDSKQR